MLQTFVGEFVFGSVILMKAVVRKYTSILTVLLTPLEVTSVRQSFTRWA